MLVFGGAKGGLSLTEEIGKGFRGAVKPVMSPIPFLQDIEIQSCSAAAKNWLITLSLLRIHSAASVLGPAAASPYQVFVSLCRQMRTLNAVLSVGEMLSSDRSTIINI